MEISVRELNGVTVVAITGSVDGLTADGLAGTLSDQVKSGCIRIVADFSGVDYTSSVGLRVLLSTMKQAR